MRFLIRLLLLLSFVALSWQKCTEDNHVYAEAEEWVWNEVFVKRCVGGIIKVTGCQIPGERIEAGRGSKKDGIEYECNVDALGNLHFHAKPMFG